MTKGGRIVTDRVQELFGAEDVKALRLRLGCTQEEFAKIVGVTVAALSRWETGRAAPRGRNGALFAFLRDRMDAGAEPETLKRLLLIGGALATGGDPPVVLMMSGRLTEEDLMRELTNLFAKEGTKR